MDNKQKKQKPGIVRWLTVGVLCYSGWLVTNLLLAVLFPALFAIGSLGGNTGRRFVRGFCVWYLRLFFIRFFSLIGVYKVAELPKPEELKQQDAQLFVANHRSWLDGLLLLALVPDVQIPVNAGYLRAPLVGPVMVWLGCVPLSRKSAEATLNGIERIRQSVRTGKKVAVFPEGTRAPKGRLKPFSGFFFRIACEENTSVLPLVLHLDYPFLGPKAENFLTARRAALTIRILKPISPQKGERGAELGRRVYKVMAPVLLELDRL